MPKFTYQVDGEEYSTDEHVLTALQILQISGVDPEQNYLVLLEGDHQRSFEDKPNEQIHMHEHMEFLTVYGGPTTVSSEVKLDH